MKLLVGNLTNLLDFENRFAVLQDIKQTSCHSMSDEIVRRGGLSIVFFPGSSSKLSLNITNLSSRWVDGGWSD
jgi:hypothetical protein